MKRILLIVFFVALIPLVQAAKITNCQLEPTTIEIGKEYFWQINVEGSAGVLGFGAEKPLVKVFLQGAGGRLLYESFNQDLGKDGKFYVGRKETLPRQILAGDCKFICQVGEQKIIKNCKVIDRTGATQEAIRPTKPPAQPSPKPGTSGRPSPQAAPAAPPKFESQGFKIVSMTVQGKTSGEVKHLFGTTTPVVVRVAGNQQTEVVLDVSVFTDENNVKRMGSKKFRLSAPLQSFTISSIGEGKFRVVAVLTDATSAQRLASLTWPGLLDSTKSQAAQKLVQAGTLREQYDSLHKFCDDLVEKMLVERRIVLQGMAAEDFKKLSDPKTRKQTIAKFAPQLSPYLRECETSYGSVNKHMLLERSIQAYSQRLTGITDGLGSGLMDASWWAVGKHMLPGSDLKKVTLRLNGLHLVAACSRKGMKTSEICSKPESCLVKLGVTVDAPEFKVKKAELEDACNEGSVQLVMFDERRNTNGDPAHNPDRLNFLLTLGMEAEKRGEFEKAYQHYLTAFNMYPGVMFSTEESFKQTIGTVKDAKAKETLKTIFYRSGYLIRQGQVGTAHSCLAGFDRCFKGLFTTGNVALIGGMIAFAAIPGPGWVAIAKQVIHSAVSTIFAVQMMAGTVQEAANGKKFTAEKICNVGCQGFMALTTSISAAKTGIKAGKSAFTEKGRAEAIYAEGYQIGKATMSEGLRADVFKSRATRIADAALKDPTSAFARGIADGKAAAGKPPRVNFNRVTESELQRQMAERTGEARGLVDRITTELETKAAEAGQLSARIRTLDQQIKQATGPRKAQLQTERAAAVEQLRQIHVDLLSARSSLQTARATLQNTFGVNLVTRFLTPAGKKLALKAREGLAPELQRLDAATRSVETRLRSLDANLMTPEQRLSPAETKAKIAELEAKAQQAVREADVKAQEAMAKESELARLKESGVTELSRLESEAARLTADIERLNQYAQEARAKADSLATKAPDVDLKGHKNLADLAREAVQRLREQAREFESAAARRQQELDRINSRITELREKQGTSVGEAPAVDSAALEAESTRLQSQISEFKEYARRARQNAETFEEMASKLDERANEYTAASNPKQAKLAQENADAARNRAAEFRRQASEFEGEAGRRQQDLDLLQARMRELRENPQAVSPDRAQLQAEIDALRAEEAALRDQASTHRAEARRLQPQTRKAVLQRVLSWVTEIPGRVWGWVKSFKEKANKLRTEEAAARADLSKKIQELIREADRLELDAGVKEAEAARIRSTDIGRSDFLMTEAAKLRAREAELRSQAAELQQRIRKSLKGKERAQLRQTGTELKDALARYRRELDALKKSPEPEVASAAKTEAPKVEAAAKELEAETKKLAQEDAAASVFSEETVTFTTRNAAGDLVQLRDPISGEMFLAQAELVAARGGEAAELLAMHGLTDRLELLRINGRPVSEWFDAVKSDVKRRSVTPVQAAAKMRNVMESLENDARISEQSAQARASGQPVPDAGTPEVPAETVEALRRATEAVPEPAAAPSRLSDLFNRPFREQGEAEVSVGTLKLLQQMLDQAARQGGSFERASAWFPSELLKSEAFMAKAREYFEWKKANPSLKDRFLSLFEARQRAAVARMIAEESGWTAKRLLDPHATLSGLPVAEGHLRTARATLQTFASQEAPWSTARTALRPLTDPNVVADAAARRWFGSKMFQAEAEAVYLREVTKALLNREFAAFEEAKRSAAGSRERTQSVDDTLTAMESAVPWYARWTNAIRTWLSSGEPSSPASAASGDQSTIRIEIPTSERGAAMTSRLRENVNFFSELLAGARAMVQDQRPAETQSRPPAQTQAGTSSVTDQAARANRLEQQVAAILASVESLDAERAKLPPYGDTAPFLRYSHLSPGLNDFMFAVAKSKTRLRKIFNEDRTKDIVDISKLIRENEAQLRKKALRLSSPAEIDLAKAELESYVPTLNQELIDARSVREPAGST